MIGSCSRSLAGCSVRNCPFTVLFMYSQDTSLVRATKSPTSPAPPGFPALPLLVTPLVAAAFEELSIGVSSFAGGVWRALHSEPNVGTTEIEHRADQLRYRYNLPCLTQPPPTPPTQHGTPFC